jgi:hypothetical protein
VVNVRSPYILIVVLELRMRILVLCEKGGRLFIHTVVIGKKGADAETALKERNTNCRHFMKISSLGWRWMKFNIKKICCPCFLWEK